MVLPEGTHITAQIIQETCDLEHDMVYHGNLGAPISNSCNLILYVECM